MIIINSSTLCTQKINSISFLQVQRCIIMLILPLELILQGDNIIYRFITFQTLILQVDNIINSMYM